ncbi:C39 family peptidase [Candidatus Saccharibacteria bacterium]|nr:C39 family peptidase [Candidatus Saccharibacteria bacterium]
MHPIQIAYKVRYVLAALLFFLSMNVSFLGQSSALENCSPEKLRDLQVAIINCSGNSDLCSTSISPLPSGSTLERGSSIYVLGDSLTVGMRDSGELDKKLRTAGWIPTKINAIGGKDLKWGIEQVNADKALLGPASSNAILVGLGTNNLGNVVSSGTTERIEGREEIRGWMLELIGAVQLANPNIKMYWTNTYGEGEYNNRSLSVGMGIINEIIAEVAAEKNMTVLPWATSTEAAEFIGDNEVHPYGGYAQMADFIVEKLGETAPVDNGSTSCCVVGGSDASSNQETVFKFFLSKGYTAEQAAGVIGNMIGESGVNPLKMQFVYSYENSSGVDKSLLEPNGDVRLANFDAVASQLVNKGVVNKVADIGYGLVQWTPASKMILTSQNASIPNAQIETIQYQLQFLWEQLSGTGLGGSVVSEKSAGDKMLLTTTVEEAAIAFGRWYERFQDSDNLGNNQYVERVSAALEAYDRLKGIDVQTVSSGVSCGYSVGVNGWDLPGEGDHPMAYYSQMRKSSAPDDPAVQGYYGDEPYGEGTIAGCGCGPTSWAMIVTTLTGKKVEPPEVANWAAENGLRSGSEACSGSAWWWTGVPAMSEARWGVKARQIALSEAADQLKAGNLILISVGEGSPLLSEGGDGHLLVMRAVTSDGRYLFADTSDSKSKRANGGDSTNPDLFKELGSSRTPLDAAQVSSGLNALFVVEKI